MLRKIQIIENMTKWIIKSNEDIQESILKYEIGLNKFEVQDFLEQKIELTMEDNNKLYNGIIHYTTEVFTDENDLYNFLSNNFGMTIEEIDKEIDIAYFEE